MIENGFKWVRKYYVGKTGNKYPVKEYINHGFGGIYRNFKDLPKDEYPYTIEYEKIKI